MIAIEKSKNAIFVREDGGERQLDLYSKEAFELLSDLWLRSSWDQKYSYTFSWMGRPIIQYPEDMVRLQEVIYSVKPAVVVETGVAHGGSLIFYASLFKAMGHGRSIVGVDIEIRPHNRQAIEAHELFPYISLVEGDAVSPQTVAHVKSLIKPDERVMVILDSDHSYGHVTKELDAYADLVSIGSYIVVTDGVMRQVADSERANPSWITDNPANAAEDFVKRDKRFIIEQPAWTFNESPLDQVITAWPSAYLKRVG